MRSWQPSFDSYICNVDGSFASIVLDLAAEGPVASHPVRIQIRVKMLQPREDGLRDRSEADALNQVEDLVTERVEKALGAIFVGRMLHKGYSEMFFYAPADAARRPDDVAALLGGLDPYRAEWLTEDDPEWSLYTDFLYPDPYALHGISNQKVVDSLRSHGDASDVPREIDHTASFPSRDSAEQAVRALVAKGYRCDDIEEGELFSLQFYRTDAASEAQTDAFTREILDILLPLEGSYDGWGCVVVKP